MPIESPRLDDLRYDRLVEELRLRIPVHTPEWTDHNDSDPGITLIQLFAHLAEMVGYRLNQIPEKNHIELLKLLGVRLQPARAARTRLAFLLADPTTLTSFTLARGAQASATVGTPPPQFETDCDIDVVPAQPAVLVTTESAELWSLGTLAAGEQPPEDSSDNRFLAVVWDGKKPKLEAMPLDPITLFPRPAQRHLWIGLRLNTSVSAGFLGARVRLTVQLDDDEQPDLTADVECQPCRPVGESPPRVDWLHYFDEERTAMVPVPGRIDDSTGRLARSGWIDFTVPLDLGPIPESMFEDLVDAVVPSALQGCQTLGTTLESRVGLITSVSDTIPLTDLQTALTDAVDDIQANALTAAPAVPHLLDPKLRDPAKVQGWLRLDLPDPLAAGWTTPELRITTFNAAAASNATVVTSELLGTTNGRAGQSFALANRDVIGDVELAIQEDVNGPLEVWEQVPSLDGKGPNERVFELDAEAGVVHFGDGIRGRIPPLVPGGGNVVARRYRHGGGAAGEVDVATITSLETPNAGLSAVVNYVAARGGADAETLAQAKERARKELSTRHRAVTRGDFQFIASQTPGVSVARVEVVPLRRPLPTGTYVAPLATVRCDGAPPTGPAGLQDHITAHGAVSVVVVPRLPDSDHPEPIPTPSFLRAVCEHLDRHRLVTTEVHVIPPQYLRLCRMRVVVRAEPGYTRTQIHTLVDSRLATYLHVLRGGEDGTGFPFGAQLHVADLVAQVLRSEGVDRVELLTAEFTRTKANASPRQGVLVLCPQRPGEYDRVQLAAEENVSVDTTTLTLTTVA